MDAQKIIQILDTLLFPRACLGCSKKDVSLCLSCLSLINITRDYRDNVTHSVYSYDDQIINKAIKRFKFYNDKTLFKTLSQPMADLILSVLSEEMDEIPEAEMVLVPIPISKRSLAIRGYNQTLALATEISEIIGIKVESTVLEKIKETKSQSGIKKRSERLKNIAGAFCVTNEQKILGKTVFLIDDVVTTGATLREARGELLRTGAKQVFCITLASQPLQ